MTKAADLALGKIAALKTALIEFTDGDDAIAVADAGVVTLLTTAVAKSEGGAVTTNIAQGLAKAWINFVGAGTSINDSLGISSLADDGTGIYTITMSSAMSNANYSITIGIKELGGGNNHAGVVKGDVTVTTTVFAMRTYSSGTPQDVTFVYDTIHGDLA